MYFLWYVLIGLAAGMIARFLVRGDRRTLFIYLIVGVVGAVLGGWLLSLFGFVAPGSLASVVLAIVGAGVLLWFAAAVAHRPMRDVDDTVREQAEEENRETLELFSEKIDRSTPCAEQPEPEPKPVKPAAGRRPANVRRKTNGPQKKTTADNRKERS